MKSGFICLTAVLLLVGVSYSAPVDEVLSVTINRTEESSQKESVINQWFQRIQRILGLNSIDDTTPSPLLNLPDDIWNSKILPNTSLRDAGSLRLANSQTRNIMRSRLSDFQAVAKACGNGTANLWIKQQWYASKRQINVFKIETKNKAGRFHKCLWATKEWVETLDQPKTIRVTLDFPNVDQSADFLADQKLFDCSSKVRFNLDIVVRESRSHLTSLFQALSINSCIQSLDIRGNCLGDDKASQLASILKTNNALKSLFLWDNGIGPKGIFSLAEALKTNTAITTFSLGKAYLSEDGIKTMVQALETNSRIEYLSLYYNNIGDQGTKLLSNALEKSAVVSYINLEGNNVTQEGAKHLSKALRRSSIKFLSIGHNVLGAEGVKELLSNTKLIELDAKHNLIDDQDSAVLVEALNNNHVLEFLKLNGCQIEKKAAAYLAEALNNNTSLRRLDLSNNNIGNDGAAAFSDMLKHNKKLQNLDLSSNMISTAGVEALAEGLERNTALKELIIFNNYVNDQGKQALVAAWKYISKRVTIRF